MTDSTASSIFVGIDVAKDKLDLGRTDSDQVLTVANDPGGIRRIVDSLRSVKPVTIVIEATGGLERRILNALIDAELPVALVNPGKVRHLAIGLGILAKTDAIDARVLAKFAQLASPRLTEKRSKNQTELDALVTCRRQLTQAPPSRPIAEAAPPARRPSSPSTRFSRRSTSRSRSWISKSAS